jgi:ribosome-associated toxin RatA of RatAB toxin-antitoxin module
MRNSIRFYLFAGTIGLAAPSFAQSTWAPPASDALAVELANSRADKQTTYTDPATNKSWGRGQILVNAPMSKVRAAVLSYGSYTTMIPRFKKAIVQKRDGDSAEVYLQIPVMGGAATIWTIQSFAAPVAEAKGEVIVGTMVKGNVDDAQCRWHYRPVDADHTIITLELHVEPRLPVSDSIVVKHIKEATGEGVLDLRNWVESH